jgi:hypothetical protein
MEEVSLARLRQLIVDIHTVCEDGLLFDTDIALQLGYSASEVECAETILELETKDSLHQLYNTYVRRCYPNADFSPAVRYFPIAKLIFITDISTGITSYIFEEDFEKDLIERGVTILPSWSFKNNAT